MNVSLKNNKFVTLLIGIFVIVFSKFFQFAFLPEKYFSDSNKLLRLVMNPSETATSSWFFSRNFYSFFYSFLHFDTLLTWAIFLAIIGNIIIYILAIKYLDFENITQQVFFYVCLTLLNIYIFNISKDFIQFMFFIIVFIIIKLIRNNLLKVTLILCIFLIESFVFRDYYILFIPIFLIEIVLLKNNKFNFLSKVLISLGCFFLIVLISQFIYPEGYNSIIFCRYNLTIFRDIDDGSSNTLVKDIVDVNNFLTFMLSYVLNFLRFAFPIELLFKGVFYIPFVLFQIFYTFSILVILRKKLSGNALYIIGICLSYFLISVIFEPDFGSFIRHEMALYPLFVVVIINLFLQGGIYNENTNYCTLFI